MRLKICHREHSCGDLHPWRALLYFGIPRKTRLPIVEPVVSVTALTLTEDLENSWTAADSRHEMRLLQDIARTLHEHLFELERPVCTMRSPFLIAE
jgi:hypothetical protein